MAIGSFLIFIEVGCNFQFVYNQLFFLFAKLYCIEPIIRLQNGADGCKKNIGLLC